MKKIGKNNGNLLYKEAFDLIKKIKKKNPDINFRDLKKIISKFKTEKLELTKLIAEHKLHLEHLENYLKTYSDLYEQSPTAYFTLSKDGKIKEVNLSGVELLGYERTFLINKSFSHFLDESQAKNFNEKLTEIFSNRSKCSTKFDITDLQGNKHLLKLDCIFTHDIEGNEICLISANDISELKNYENALEASEERFRNVFEFSPYPMFILDRQLNISYINNSFKEITGYSFKDFKNISDLFSLIYPDESIRKTMEKKLYADLIKAKSSHGSQTMINIQSKKGHKRSILTKIIEINDGNILATGIDVTKIEKAKIKLKRLISNLKKAKDNAIKRSEEIERLNKDLLATQSTLKEINASKDKYFSILAHDLNGPINSICSLISIIKDDINKTGSFELIETFDIINSSLNRLKKLLDNLFLWVKFQRGAIETRIEHINIISFLSIITKSHQENASSKNINIICTVDANYSCHADSSMLQKALDNIISNSIKYSNPNSEISIFIEQHNNNYICLNVKDNGIGMEAELLNKIPNLEEQYGKFISPNDKINGLGLILSKLMVESFGGFMKIESNLNQGTTVKIYLPV